MPAGMAGKPDAPPCVNQCAPRHVALKIVQQGFQLGKGKGAGDKRRGQDRSSRHHDVVEDLDGRVHEAGQRVDGPAMGGILHHRAVNQPGRGVGRLASKTLSPPFIFRVSGQFAAIPLCLHDMDAP